MPPVGVFSVKREQNLESLKKQEEVNELEGDVIIERGLTVEISRMSELLQAICGVLAGDDVVKIKQRCRHLPETNTFFLHPHQ